MITITWKKWLCLLRLKFFEENGYRENDDNGENGFERP